MGWTNVYVGAYVRIKLEDAEKHNFTYAAFYNLIDADRLCWHEIRDKHLIFISPNTGKIGKYFDEYDAEVEIINPYIQEEISDFKLFFAEDLKNITVPYEIVWGIFNYWS